MDQQTRGDAPGRRSDLSHRCLTAADTFRVRDIGHTCLGTSCTPQTRGCTVSMARLVVTAVLVEGRSKSEVARDYGVSRRWVITLTQRFLAEGEAGLEPRSRRPRRSPQRTAEP